MRGVTNSLLRDTLHLVSLAREAARARGDLERAERLAPVQQGLRSLLEQGETASPARSHGILAGEGFQALLRVAQMGRLRAGAAPGADRHSVAAAMAAGGMSEVDIARHLGMTREEVRLLLANPARPQPAGVGEVGT